MANEAEYHHLPPLTDANVVLQSPDPPAGLKRTKSGSESSGLQLHKSPENFGFKPASQPPQTPPAVHKDEDIDPLHVPHPQTHTNGASHTQIPSINEPKSTPTPPAHQPQTPPTSKSNNLQKTPSPDESKHSKLSLKKDGRRSSWFSSLGSKLSGSDKSSRNSSVSSAPGKKSPQPSPSFEKPDPLEASKLPSAEVPGEEKPVHVGPRRPSVLVAAGTETKLDHPGFLTNALRRLSSGNTATLGKAATGGALCPRKIMNIDQNRQRTKIVDFDQNKLRRVAFKVDVEIAGIAAQADEQEDQKGSASNAGAAKEPPTSKDSKMAKYKDMSEGAALKKTTSREANAADPALADDAKEETKEDIKKEKVKEEVKEVEEKAEKEVETPKDEKPAEGDQPPTTRKKEKKKRSEAERKERKERKRRQAEANGLIPLEITLEDDSDSSGNNTPAGASTPRKGQPTTDPLRIYKRCCQLRETTALSIVKEQIARPTATLAEAPGIVASLDLSGTEMALADIQTLGDWLAVVPVRRLILDDCNLSDEAVRILLSGLSGCKNQEQAKANKKLPRRGSGKSGVEQMGVIEKLSMKNNTAISAIGWKHIALFIHLCRSLRGIDLSGIPLPATARGDLSRTSTTSSTLTAPPDAAIRHIDLSTLFARALGDRFGTNLEELILSGCGLTSHAVSEIVDSVIKCKIKRLGLAHNDLRAEALAPVVKYVVSGVCEGLDMGGNDLRGSGHLITEVLDDKNPLFAMSLADCSLGVDDLRPILQHLSTLQNFKFIDLSQNHDLFQDTNDGVVLLRKRLPHMKELKRIHLADVNMTPNQLIALAEIFPDCPALAHVSILNNQSLVECMNSNQGEDQEEACAVFVSLMTAARASRTLVAVEVEVPSQDSSEVVKALASQVVAYCLRNLERTTLTDIGVQDNAMPEKLDKQAPEVLLHLVGHMDGYSENHDQDEPAPDEDYLMATNGIVKALGVCLGTKEASRMHSRNISPSASGTATPRSGHLKPQGQKKPKDVSLELCESARKIRIRLRPAMVKEDRAGNRDAYRESYTVPAR